MDFLDYYKTQYQIRASRHVSPQLVSPIAKIPGPKGVVTPHGRDAEAGQNV